MQRPFESSEQIVLEVVAVDHHLSVNETLVRLTESPRQRILVHKLAILLATFSAHFVVVDASS